MAVVTSLPITRPPFFQGGFKHTSPRHLDFHFQCHRRIPHPFMGVDVVPISKRTTAGWGNVYRESCTILRGIEHQSRIENAGTVIHNRDPHRSSHSGLNTDTVIHNRAGRKTRVRMHLYMYEKNAKNTIKQILTLITPLTHYTAIARLT